MVCWKSAFSASDLAGALHLVLGLRHGSRGLGDLLGEVLDGLREVRDLRGQGLLLVVAGLGGAVVLVELVDAPVAVGDLVLHLLAELGDHLVDLLLDHGEGVQLHAGGDQGERRGAALARGRLKHRDGVVAHGHLGGAAAGHLDEGVAGLVEGLEGLVVVEDLDGVLDRRDLGHAVLHALVELGGAVGALVREVGEEGLVEAELLLGRLELLEGLGVLLLQVRDHLVELRDHRPAGGDLLLLGRLKRQELLDGLLLLGLVVAEVLREVLLHLREDAGDLAALRRVALHAGDGEEGGGALGLGDVAEEGLERGHLLGAEDDLGHHGGLLEVHRGLLDLGEARGGVGVLAEGDEGTVAGGDGLLEVHLLGVGLLVLLHAHGLGLLERVVVGVHLIQGRVALGLHLLHLRRGLAEEGLELRDLGLAELDGRGLLLLVGLAPAVQHLVDGLVVVQVPLELRLHVLEQADHLHDRPGLHVLLGVADQGLRLRGDGRGRRIGDQEREEDDREASHDL